MPLVTKQLVRVFTYNGTEITDPAPGSSPERVREILATSYPALTNAVVEPPVAENGKLVFNFKVAVGTKG